MLNKPTVFFLLCSCGAVPGVWPADVAVARVLAGRQAAVWTRLSADSESVSGGAGMRSCVLLGWRGLNMATSWFHSKTVATKPSAMLIMRQIWMENGKGGCHWYTEERSSPLKSRFSPTSAFGKAVSCPLIDNAVSNVNASGVLTTAAASTPSLEAVRVCARGGDICHLFIFVACL